MSNVLLGASRVFATTDGADKFIKLVIGFLTVESTRDVAAKAHCANAAQHLAEARSFMRVGRVFNLVLKLLSLRDLFAAQGFKYTENKKFVEFVKTIFDLLFAVCDHVVVLAREGFVSASVGVARLARSTRVVQVLCHVLGVVHNLLDLRDAARRLVYDPPAAERACKIAGISALRDVADALVAVSFLGHAHNGWMLSVRSEGVLTFFSGALSTYLCWKYS
ncbi:glycosomal membrane protein-like protein [Leptomonas pyrrhocoris]|uniref:Glycosomal membrane protein-like protein n=1 Tax=Leptomonas pyrrhocoris TaxID=157538 RepID=A0A0N0DZE5_LEPPY|nr:glycosomal membrane protein-like protein [Leptomonas pyrrhocoris]KPA85191.1 glycosomal membrane protein-like protein [Leptomonas pyrrhocoris]|eukprot:XP_015663630.1 glycosomal membrane protein-like protein [Leptomonas pyrrhocoris]